MKIFNYIIIILLIIFLFNSYKYNKQTSLERSLLDFVKSEKIKNVNFNNEKTMISIIKEVRFIRKNNENIKEYSNDNYQPKISFISTVFNKEKYLNSFLYSIQNQYIEEFELLIVDDCSTDMSNKIINKFAQKDKRIKIIKNKINKGALFSRYNAALKSKGEYILFVDSDDILLKKGLYNVYNYIKNNDLSIVQFHSIIQRNDSILLNSKFYKYKNVIKQPILSYIFYYDSINRKGDEQNTALWDKLINHETLSKALSFMGKSYLHEKIKIENDVILLFSIFHSANSYQYINEIGYYYIRNSIDSTTNSWNSPEKANEIAHGLFTNIKFLFEKTNDSYIDKSFSLFKLIQSFNRYKKCFQFAIKEYDFIQNVINLLLNSEYISNRDKLIILNIENVINNMQERG